MAQLIKVAEAGSSNSRQRQVRLTKEGTAFLTNYARTVNSYPKKAEKEAILTRLNAIPGNEAFTLKGLTNWFARHRNPVGVSVSAASPPRVEPRAVLVDDETILFPKLTPRHLQQLRVLYKKRAYPSDGIITFWADRIKTDKAEVIAWIQYQQEKAKENNLDAVVESPDIPLQQLAGDPMSDSASLSPIIPDHPRPHLPTPSKSLSPSPQTRMPSLPPIAVKTEDSRSSLVSTSPPWQPTSLPHPTEPCRASDGLSMLSKPQQTVTLVPSANRSPPLTSLSVGAPSSSQELSMSLAAAIRDSLRPDSSRNASPNTTGEFLDQFKQVETMIGTFLQKHDTGQLTRLGWDPSSNTSAS